MSGGAWDASSRHHSLASALRLGGFGLLAATILLAGRPASAQPGRKQVLEGNKLFKQQKYDAAFNRYRDAQIADPTSPIVEFNVGDALYKKRNFEEALKSYQKVAGADDPAMAAKAYYNLGNTLYRLGKLPESILAYKKALQLNPDDEDAKYNLEYVRAKLKQQAQNQSQSGQQQQQQQQGQQDQSNQQQQQRQQSQQQQDQQQQGEKQNQEQQSAAEQQQMQQGKKLSKKDAERILDALKNQEKQVKRVQPRRTRGRRRVLKDW